MEDLLGQFTTSIGTIIPNVALVFGGLLGLVAVVALGYFVVNRVRGSIR